MTLARVTGNWIRLLLHGRSADRSDVKESIELARDRGHHVEVRVSWETGDMRRLAGEAVEEGVEVVVAGGGDGTVSEVVSGLFEATDSISQRPSLGILPLGRANAFARSCMIPANPWPAFELICSTNPLLIDVARSGNRILVNVAIGGIGPKIDAGIRAGSGIDLQRTNYFVSSLYRLKSLVPQPTVLSGPGFEWIGTCLVLAIGNGRQIAGDHVLCPNALIDDGLIDLSVLPGISQGGIDALYQDLMSGGSRSIEDCLIQARVPWVKIDFEEEHPIDIDGQPQIRKRFHFEVEPRSLRVHLPEGNPLLCPAHQRAANIKSFREHHR